MSVIDSLRTSKKEIKVFNYDLILFLIYLFSLTDLLLTAYIESHIWASMELNPLYHLWGRDALVWGKLLLPFVIRYMSVKKKTLIPLYIVLMLMIWVCFWNVLVLLSY